MSGWCSRNTFGPGRSFLDTDEALAAAYNTVVYLMNVGIVLKFKISNDQRLLLVSASIMCHVFRCKDDGRMVECET